ncbi:hypothetical protein KKG71_02145 [Patescibacteria group bacterium]|nr:hypothetical protein [Patescibacteria group bacterium]
MTQFKAINPSVEVNGQTVFAIVDGMGDMKNMAFQILEENGISDLKPENWYSQQSWLDAFKQISEKIGPATLNEIGKKIPENAKFPPEINDIHKALASIDVAYHLNHRLDGEIMFDTENGSMKVGIGHYRYRKISDRCAEVECYNPYPCEFDKGIVTAMAQKFKPADSYGIEVDSSGKCRKNGDESCTYRVRW